MNFNPGDLKVEYVKGNKGYFKQFPANSIVAMKDLNDFSQISNQKFLVGQGVTILNYETGVYLNRNGNTPTGTSLPFVFIDNNAKPSEMVTVAPGYSGTTTISGMTFTVNNYKPSTLFSIITSATTMTNNTRSVSASTSNVVVYFSGASTTTQDIYAALSGSSFSGFGITMTGQGATKINTGGTVQFYLSATTVDVNSGYVFLQRMV